ncbi:MAG: hypothetical protein ACLSX5_01280 [Lachnospiraceae bacterium]
MIGLWNRSLVYRGKSMAESARIRDLLSANSLDYTWKVHNRSSKWSGRYGGGTVRAQFGSAGDPDPYEYEIFVHKKNYELAKALIEGRTN